MLQAKIGLFQSFSIALASLYENERDEHEHVKVSFADLSNEQPKLQPQAQGVSTMVVFLLRLEQFVEKSSQTNFTIW